MISKNVPQDIRNIAKQDFNSAQRSINRKQDEVTASAKAIKYDVTKDYIEATCTFELDGDSKSSVQSSIRYSLEDGVVYANKNISDVTKAILSDISVSTPITAAEDDEDEFGFDDFEDEGFNDEPMEDSGEDEEIPLEEGEELEDPEEEPNIETENNIENHYIVECDRCHGIFISALVESDQVIDHISGVCPLCEKESDQYVKWVVKPVEF